MLDRFYVPGDWTHGLPTLPDAEFHHLARVLRKQPGDLVELFDGQGRRITARVEQLGKRQALLSPVGDAIESAPPRIAITVAIAPPKGERFKWLVEKCTELGVSRIIPLRTERSVVDAGAGKLDKLELTIVAACKQSRRDCLLELAPTQPLTQAAAQWTGQLVLLGDPQGISPGPLLAARFSTGGQARRCTIVVGPEGGLTAGDRKAIDASTEAIAVALGEYVLRVETAAVALAAAVRACC